MAQDLKIELRKLLALHMATLHVEHAIRETAHRNNPWNEFAPSRFIYAFFTFNSIYSWDWESSFYAGALTGWPENERGHKPKEAIQFKKYIKFCNDTLGSETMPKFKSRFVEACD